MCKFRNTFWEIGNFMHIKSIIIKNFKCFEGRFDLEFNNGLNILVGDNETGKSTILEAVHLALSGWIYGKYLKTELTQSLFNHTVIENYLDSLKTDNPIPPPEILIELYFDIDDDPLQAMFEGNGNILKHKACGIQFKISFNDKFQNVYNILLKKGDEVRSLPIEYYDFSWSSFARDTRLTPKTIPFKSALIDSSNNRYQSGSDMYLLRIIRDFLSDEQKVNISQAHRRLIDLFNEDDAIKNVNKELEQKKLSDKNVKLSVNMSTKTAWETSITTYLDNIPFSNIGRGEQCLIKTKLALSHKKSKEANILLLEEPENHLSYTKLNKFIKYIKDNHDEKQIIVSTHSSFVANKLGLGSLILLNINQNNQKRHEARITGLDEDTKQYFEKLAGFDTLRLLLCKKAILVEGPSDELIVQKAYMTNNKEKLPIEDEIDVISVGTSFLRFLEIAKLVQKPVAIVTDNDGNIDGLQDKYQDYLGDNLKDNIKICYDDEIDSGNLKINNRDFNYNTLEPKIVKVNSLSILNSIFNKSFKSNEDLHQFMYNNKTDCALKIFKTDKEIAYPQYILDAIC